MSSKITSLLFAVLFIGVLSASNAGVTALLKSYNVSSTLISGATFTNISYGSHSYVLVYSGSSPVFLINTSTSDYHFILNAATIATIITPTIQGASLKAVNFAPAAQALGVYLNGSSYNLTDCLIETGIDRGTCTYANLCQSCASVPSCNEALYATDGPGGTLGTGIASFEIQYNQLESNLTIFNNYSSSKSTASPFVAIQKLLNALANVSTITQTIGQNPIFPPLASSDLSLCGGLGGNIGFNLSSSSGPWYCNAIGYCGLLTYQPTQLNNVTVQLNGIAASLPTSAKIAVLAQSVNASENAYIVPTLVAQKSTQLAVVLNTTLKGLSTTTNASALLGLHISNATLQTETALVSSDYSYLKTNYAQINITSYAAALQTSLAQLRATYLKVNATYSSLLSEARNNTVVLVAAQLNGDTSNKTAALAFQEAQANGQFGSQVQNTTALLAQLFQIDNLLPNYGLTIDFSLEGVSRAINEPFVSFMSSVEGLSYQSTIASAPFLSSILSLIIGIILLALLFFYHLRLQARRKLKVSHRTSRAWLWLFIIVIAIVLIFVFATYEIASIANSSAPANLFTDAVHSSRSLVIALNGTSPALSTCASEITAYATAYNYTATTIYTSGNVCSGPGIVDMNVSQCMTQYARSRTPVVALSIAGTQSISVYSFYGTVMTANGDSAFINACYPAFFIR